MISNPQHMNVSLGLKSKQEMNLKTLVKFRFLNHRTNSTYKIFQMYLQLNYCTGAVAGAAGAGSAAIVIGGNGVCSPPFSTAPSA